jgi:hypothetical protein
MNATVHTPIPPDVRIALELHDLVDELATVRQLLDASIAVAEAFPPNPAIAVSTAAAGRLEAAYRRLEAVALDFSLTRGRADA